MQWVPAELCASDRDCTTQLGRAVLVEQDMAVGVSVRVGIEIDVVVVRHETDAGLAAGVREGQELLQAAAGGRCPEAVVVAPSLPDVLHEKRVGQAVLRRPADALLIGHIARASCRGTFCPSAPHAGAGRSPLCRQRIAGLRQMRHRQTG